MSLTQREGEASAEPFSRITAHQEIRPPYSTFQFVPKLMTLGVA